MKKFIKRFLLFFLVCLAISFIADMFISYRLKNSVSRASGEFAVWNDIYQGKINSDIVIYGSSRAWVHFDPLLITKAFNISCYNLGIDGQNFGLQYFRHRELLRFNKRPRIIIMSVDIFSFTRHAGLFNSEQFLPYMFFSQKIEQVLRPYAGYNVFDFIIPAFRYAGKKEIVDDAFETSQQSHSARRIKGFMGMEKSWNNDFDSVKKSMVNYTLEIDDNLHQNFEKFIKECRQNNIKLIMVYSPEYFEGQKFVSNRQQLMSIYKSLATQYQLPYYDFSDDSISYQKKYFYNTQHLNKEGAKVFTENLIKNLKQDRIIPETLLKDAIVN